MLKYLNNNRRTKKFTVTTHINARILLYFLVGGAGKEGTAACYNVKLWRTVCRLVQAYIMWDSWCKFWLYFLLIMTLKQVNYDHNFMAAEISLVTIFTWQ